MSGWDIKKKNKGERVYGRKKTTTRTGFHINIMRGLCTFLVGLRGTSSEPLHCLFIRFGWCEITIRPFADLPIKHLENANRKPFVVLLPVYFSLNYIWLCTVAHYMIVSLLKIQLLIQLDFNLKQWRSNDVFNWVQLIIFV